MYICHLKLDMLLQPEIYKIVEIIDLFDFPKIFGMRLTRVYARNDVSSFFTPKVQLVIITVNDVSLFFAPKVQILRYIPQLSELHLLNKKPKGHGSFR